MIRTHIQYRTAIAKLGLSQLKAAKFLGISDRQSRRLALDETEIPRSIGLLLAAMLKAKLMPADLDPDFISPHSR